MNAATPLVAWGRSVISLGRHVGKWEPTGKVEFKDFELIFKEASEAMKIVWVSKLYTKYKEFQKADATMLNARERTTDAGGGMFKMNTWEYMYRETIARVKESKGKYKLENAAASALFWILNVNTDDLPCCGSFQWCCRPCIGEDEETLDALEMKNFRRFLVQAETFFPNDKSMQIFCGLLEGDPSQQVDVPNNEYVNKDGVRNIDLPAADKVYTKKPGALYSDFLLPMGAESTHLTDQKHFNEKFNFLWADTMGKLYKINKCGPLPRWCCGSSEIRRIPPFTTWFSDDDKTCGPQNKNHEAFRQRADLTHFQHTFPKVNWGFYWYTDVDRREAKMTYKQFMRIFNNAVQVYLIYIIYVCMYMNVLQP